MPAPFHLKPPARRRWPTSHDVSWWDPSRWYKTVSQYFDGIDDRTRHLIVKGILDAANLVHEDVHTTWNLSSSWTMALEAYTENGLEAASDASTGAARTGVGAAKKVQHHSEGLFSSLWHDAASLFDTARHDIAAAFDSVIHFFESFLDHYVFPYAVDLWRWWLNAFDWWWGLEVKGFQWLWHHAIDPAYQDGLHAFHRIERIEGFLFGDMLAMFHLLEECFEWLVWFATHSFEDLAKLASSGGADLEKWLASPPAGEPETH